MDLSNNLYNKQPTKQINKFIKNLYNKLQKGHKVLNNTQINIINTILGARVENKWIPSQINEFISNHHGNTYKVTASISSRNITIFFVCYDNTDKETILYYSNYIFLVIYLLTTGKTICSKNLTIKLYLTPFTKKSPDNYKNPLGINEINTGFSNIGCKQYSDITIYRKEEWFKVLIHELFHNLNLDFATVNINYAREKLHELLNLNIKYDINETYAETWARLLLIGIVSDIKSSNYNDFNKHYIKILSNEIIFSIMQATKVLKHVNVMNKYKEYKENTHAYAYYVFTAALMNNYLDFIKWCYNNNENLFFFIKKDSNVKSFTDLIISSLNNESLQKKLTYLYFHNKTPNKTMRMTSINIF
jgi:hypothetical protein